MYKVICDKCGKELKMNEEIRIRYFNYSDKNDDGDGSFDFCQECGMKYIQAFKNECSKGEA